MRNFLIIIFLLLSQPGKRTVHMTSNSYKFRTRGNAMAALRRMAYCNDDLIAHAVKASLSANGFDLQVLLLPKSIPEINQHLFRFTEMA